MQGEAPEIRQRPRGSLPHPPGTVQHEGPVNTSCEGGNAFGERIRAKLAQQSIRADTGIIDCEAENVGNGDEMTITRQVEEYSDGVIDVDGGSSKRTAPAYGGAVGDWSENQRRKNAR